jgi:hypothetical protein
VVWRQGDFYLSFANQLGAGVSGFGRSGSISGRVSSEHKVDAYGRLTGEASVSGASFLDRFVARTGDQRVSLEVDYHGCACSVERKQVSKVGLPACQRFLSDNNNDKQCDRNQILRESCTTTRSGFRREGGDVL